VSIQLHAKPKERSTRMLINQLLRTMTNTTFNINAFNEKLSFLILHY